MRGHGAAVAESPVRLDHKQRLICALCQPVLLVQQAQVLQIPHENAVHVIHPREQAAIIATFQNSNQPNQNSFNRKAIVPILPSIAGKLRCGVC